MTVEPFALGTHTETRERLAVWRVDGGLLALPVGQHPPAGAEVSVPDRPAPGLRRHYKGAVYRVLGVAHAPGREPLVVYHPEHQPATVWLREVWMFCEHVLADGVRQPRFRALEARSRSETAARTATGRARSASPPPASRKAQSSCPSF